MDKQTTGWWILLAFSLRLAFLLSLASDQLTLAGCSLDGLALWAPLRLVPVVPVDRAFVGACLSPLSLSLPRPTLPFPFFLFLFFFPWLSFHPQSILAPSFLVTFFRSKAGVGFTLSAVHLAVHSFSFTSPVHCVVRPRLFRPPDRPDTFPLFVLNKLRLLQDSYTGYCYILLLPVKHLAGKLIRPGSLLNYTSSPVLSIRIALQYIPFENRNREPYPTGKLDYSKMMHLFKRLVARDDEKSNDDRLTPAMIDLLIALLVLVLVGIALVGALLVLRRKRQNRKRSELPVHNGQCTTHHRSLTISAPPYAKTESVLVYDEKKRLMENSSSPPPSPVPEIRITFPEEEDESGKRKSGRMVVVRISDAGGVGLEPCHDELPPYQSSDAERFQSLDIERMGGLKEKEDVKRWS